MGLRVFSLFCPIFFSYQFYFIFLVMQHCPLKQNVKMFLCVSLFLIFILKIFEIILFLTLISLIN